MLTVEQVLSRAETLARQAAAAGVTDEQVGLALTHLKRHRDVGGTLALLEELKKSPFSQRSRQTPRQFAALEECVRSALQGVSSWEEAAAIVGWARRLVVVYQPEWRPPRGDDSRRRADQGGRR
jgi:hypothetical protein